MTTKLVSPTPYRLMSTTYCVRSSLHPCWFNVDTATSASEKRNQTKFNGIYKNGSVPQGLIEFQELMSRGFICYKTSVKVSMTGNEATSDCVPSMTDWVGKVDTLYHTPNIRRRRKEIKSFQWYENISFMTDGCHCEKIMGCVVITWWTTTFFKNITNLEKFISHPSLLLARVEWECMRISHLYCEWW